MPSYDFEVDIKSLILAAQTAAKLVKLAEDKDVLVEDEPGTQHPGRQRELIDVASRHDRAQHAHYAHSSQYAHAGNAHASPHAHAEHAHGSSHGYSDEAHGSLHARTDGQARGSDGFASSGHTAGDGGHGSGHAENHSPSASHRPAGHDGDGRSSSDRQAGESSRATGGKGDVGHGAAQRSGGEASAHNGGGSGHADHTRHASGSGDGRHPNGDGLLARDGHGQGGRQGDSGGGSEHGSRGHEGQLPRSEESHPKDASAAARSQDGMRTDRSPEDLDKDGDSRHSGKKNFHAESKSSINNYRDGESDSGSDHVNAKEREYEHDKNFDNLEENFEKIWTKNEYEKWLLEANKQKITAYSEDYKYQHRVLGTDEEVEVKGNGKKIWVDKVTHNGEIAIAMDAKHSHGGRRPMHEGTAASFIVKGLTDEIERCGVVINSDENTIKRLIIVTNTEKAQKFYEEFLSKTLGNSIEFQVLLRK